MDITDPFIAKFIYDPTSMMDVCDVSGRRRGSVCSCRTAQQADSSTTRGGTGQCPSS